MLFIQLANEDICSSIAGPKCYGRNCMKNVGTWVPYTHTFFFKFFAPVNTIGTFFVYKIGIFIKNIQKIVSIPAYPNTKQKLISLFANMFE